MDKNRYKLLDSDQKRVIWERLSDNPDFQLLRDLFYEETRVRVRPTTLDKKEDFYALSIRAQAIQDVLNFPLEQIRERGKYLTDKADEI